MEAKINCENLRSGRGHFASDSRPNLQYSKKGGGGGGGRCGGGGGDVVSRLLIVSK